MEVGCFVVSPHSSRPSLLVQEIKGVEPFTYLASIDEYKGDYRRVSKDECKKVDLRPHFELSLLSRFGDWFYEEHKTVYQEILMNALVNRVAD